jgi:arylsulfatase A-like enzyme
MLTDLGHRWEILMNRALFLFASFLITSLLPGGTIAAERPNVLWFIVDDMSANFSCYGEKTISTPHVDRLAREGTMFRRAFVTAPVCSPCRSALITGMYQTSIGAHHHRSGRGVEKIRLPVGVVPVPVLFKEAGYYTCIGGPSATGKKLGKTDYNFEWDPKMYDGNDWSGRKPGQPFFMQVQLHGGKYREGKGWRERVEKELGSSTKPEDVTLPPYYPREPILLDDWARYLDACRYTDKEVGEVLARLEKEGILEETLIVFMTDHGISHARGKQFLYDEGTHVPLVIRGPGVEKGSIRNDFAMHIDLAPLSLAAAGIEIPDKMQGRDLFSRTRVYKPRDSVFAARDRCDETTEHLRSVRTEHWLYIRNGHPDRPHLQPNRYKDAKAIVKRLRELHAEGTLDELQERLLFSPTRPKEELYEWLVDRHQIKNLAGDPAHAKTLAEMRGRLDHWMAATNDHGRTPESDKMYDSDMAVYLGNKSNPQGDILERNIAQMKRWAKEGK